jgi:N-terminal domain of argonaute
MDGDIIPHALRTRLWNCETSKEYFGQYCKGGMPIWDGMKVAYSKYKIPQHVIRIDLDKLKGREPRPGKKPDTHTIRFQESSTVNLTALSEFIDGRYKFDNEVLKSISRLPCPFTDTDPILTYIPSIS